MVVLVAAGGLTVWAYVPALDGPFVFDDLSNVVDSPALRWDEVSLDNVRGVLTQARLQRRPVANLSFALDHRIWGMDPGGFHLTNVLIHLLTGLALFGVAVLYLRNAARPPPGEDRPAAAPLAAALGAAVFLLHPLNTQAVAYVVQRMASLSALFVILAFGAYLLARHGSGRRRVAGYAAAVLFLALGVGSKENAVLLLPVVAVYELCFFRSEWRGRVERVLGIRWDRHWTMGSVAAGVMLVALAGLVVVANLRTVGFSTDFGYRDFTGWERVLTQPRVQLLYLSLLLWPSPARLNLDYDFTVSRALLDPPVTLLATWAVLGLLAGAVFLAIRKPRYGFPLLAYALFHAVEAGPVDLELVYEHRMYLPVTALVLLGAAVLSDLRSGRRLFAAALVAALCLPLAGWTHARNQFWGNELLLQEDIARKAPNKARAQHNWARALADAGRYEEALPIAERAITLLPDETRPRMLTGRILVSLDRADDAIPYFSSAVELDPDDISAHLGLGSALAAAGRPDQAIQHYLFTGMRLARSGKVWESIPILQAAVELQPSNAGALNSLGSAYLTAGLNDRAAQSFREAIQADPNLATAWYNLGLASDALGRPGDAIQAFREFVRLAPPELASAIQTARARIAQLEGGA